MKLESVHIRVHFESSGATTDEDGHSKLFRHRSLRTALRNAVWYASYFHRAHGGTSDWSYRILSIRKTFMSDGERIDKKASRKEMSDANKIIRKKPLPKDVKISKKSYNKMFAKARKKEKPKLERRRIITISSEIKALQKERMELIKKLHKIKSKR